MRSMITFNRSNYKSSEDNYKIEITTSKELGKQEYFELTEAINQITDFFDKHMQDLEEAERKQKEKEEKENK